MIFASPPPQLTVDQHTLDTSFDREPFGFTHSLSDGDLLGFDSLRTLAARYIEADADYFVASGAPAVGTTFYSVPHSLHRPHEALDLLDSSEQRVLLKRPENYDARFRDLLDTLFAQVRATCAIDGTIVRLDSSILISSAHTLTPFHFDPEISFFFQIAGAKNYTVHSPSTLGEYELERFYKRGVVDIGQVDYAGRDLAKATLFELGPGKGLHQPQNAPHWVQTESDRSISYVFSFETDRSRARGRTRAFNAYARQIGFTPDALESHSGRDALKARVMQALLPARNRTFDFIGKFANR